MISIVEARAGGAHDGVERKGHAREKRAEAGAHRPAVVGLDDEVDVIVLHREVDGPEVGAVRDPQRLVKRRSCCSLRFITGW